MSAKEMDELNEERRRSQEPELKSLKEKFILPYFEGKYRPLHKGGIFVAKHGTRSVEFKVSLVKLLGSSQPTHHTTRGVVFGGAEQYRRVLCLARRGEVRGHTVRVGEVRGGVLCLKAPVLSSHF